jgi:hypothetical protein
MKLATHGIWRPVRCLLLVVCAGGILAADNSWINTFDLDFAYPGLWFATVPLENSPAADLALSAPQENIPRAQLSMGQLVNGLLFSRPGRGWMLVASADESRSDFGGRITEFDPINQYQRSDNFGSFSAPISVASVAISGPVARASTNTITPNTITTGTGTWAVDNSGTWTNPANWASNNVPDGSGSFADISQVDLTANRTVTLDVSRTVGRLTIGDTNGTHSYILDASAGATLTFDQSPNFGNAGVLTQSATSAGDTISAPIVIGNVNYLSVQNFSAAPLTVSGNISSGAGVKTIEFDGPGNFNVTGIISNGATGNSITVGAISGIVTLTGANTYGGGTSVAGTLFVNNTSGSGTGSGMVSVYNSGTLGGTGTIGGSVSIGNGATITGGTTTTVGTLTLLSNLSLSVFEGGPATYLVNLSGSTSDLLAISGTLSIVGNSHIHFDGSVDNVTTYKLATYLSEGGSFIVDNLPTGYSLVYLPTELDLVPIPEPATWIGGALALGAIAFTQRRRLRRLIPRRV